MTSSLSPGILNAWRGVAQYIASDHAADFIGRSKEALVFDRLRTEIEHAGLAVTGSQVPFRIGESSWKIDLVCKNPFGMTAIEGKFKLASDGAIPDNRKAGFFDLFKLENYVYSGIYSEGLFLWLTNECGYYSKRPAGDSRDFSTHHGRVYEPGTVLNAQRSRNGEPLRLSLGGRYLFQWEAVPNTDWRYLVLMVESKPRH